MKSILMSIQPKWCEKIINGKKTIEVRKTAPKAPFRAFIYCTKQRFPNKKYLYINETSVRSEYGVCDDWLKYDTDTLNINEGTPYQYETYFANGKIIGEFICDKVICLTYETKIPTVKQNEDGTLGIVGYTTTEPFYNGKLSTIKGSCLEQKELLSYGKGNDIYGLHITALKIFDKPRELGEFYGYNKELEQRFLDGEDYCCHDATNEYGEAMTECDGENIHNCYRCWEEWSGWCHSITRPPQSWQYVGEIEE